MGIHFLFWYTLACDLRVVSHHLCDLRDGHIGLSGKAATVISSVFLHLSARYLGLGVLILA